MRPVWRTVAVSILSVAMLVAPISLSASVAAAADTGCNVTDSGTHCYVQGVIDRADLHAHGVGASFDEPFALADVTADGYSIGQLSIQRAIRQGDVNTGEAVEFGWMVNPDKFKNALPHLFLAVRKPGSAACLIGIPNLRPKESGCPFNLEDVWHQQPSTKHLGDPVYGANLYHVGYYAGNKAWWVQYGGEWLGYVKASYFNDGFSDANDVRWFGEVVYDKNPCIPMGNGAFGSTAGSARIFGMFYEAAGKSALVHDVNPVITTSKSSAWDAGDVGPDHFRFGGPGCAGAR